MIAADAFGWRGATKAHAVECGASFLHDDVYALELA
jgi:hypothetical protein